MKIKLFVDDIRNAPDDSWVVARTVTEAIRTIDKFEIEELSLDHDISHQVTIEKLSRPYPCNECFCAVAHYIGASFMREPVTPKVTLHTSNPVGAAEMKGILGGYAISSTIKLTGISNRLEMEV